MTKQNGITLISLIIYVIVILISVTIITNITSSMTKNLGSVEKSSKDVSKINKFDLYFISDIKDDSIKIYDIKNEENNKYIILENNKGDDIQYIYNNNAIYRIENSNTQVKICNGLTRI